MDAVEFGCLDEVSEFLRANPGSGVAWSPDGARLSTTSILTEYRVRKRVGI